MTVKREPSNVKRGVWLRSVFLLTLAYSLGIAASPAHAFMIVDPAEGAKLTSGTTVTARVDLGKDSGIVQVRYYWYAEQD